MPSYQVVTPKAAVMRDRASLPECRCALSFKVGQLFAAESVKYIWEFERVSMKLLIGLLCLGVVLVATGLVLLVLWG